VDESHAVIDRADESRVTITVDGHTAELRYQVERGYLVLIHTEVPQSLGGRGIGGVLVEAAVDRAVRDDLVIVPLCPFARRWLERHPDTAARATVDWELGT
jgi:predicted GNAT family acetyltransferase